MTLKYIAIPAGACFDQRVSPQQLRTLVIIAYYGSLSDRRAYPSYKRLCEDVGITKRLLISYIKHLCTLGYLEKKQRTRPDGSATSNIYHVPLNISMAPEEDDTMDSAADTSGAQAGEGVVLPSSTTPGDTGQHPPSATQQHPSNNTSLNQKKKNTKKAEVMKLEEWEEKQGAQLCVAMLDSWCKDNSFDREKVSALVQEFRLVMKANGNVYADFKACFQNYVNRGYLSKGAAALKVAPTAAAQPKFETFDKGVSL